MKGLTREHVKALSPWRCPNCGYRNLWDAAECKGCQAPYEDQEEFDRRRRRLMKKARK